MNIVTKMMMGSAAITTVIMVYKVYISLAHKKLFSNKQTNVKKEKKQKLRQNVDKYHLALHNSHWKKIGKVIDLMIYPVKSSEEPVRYDFFQFCDYGICRQEYGTHFWDGMFFIYNKTNGKFEDSRRYSLLKSMKAELTNTAEVTLSGDGMTSTVELNMDHNPSNRFVKETWSGTLEEYYDSNQEVNTWVKSMIEVHNEDVINEDVILAQMLPSNWDSTRRIKDNWSLFVQGYEAMEQDTSGKLITLPRFILMTTETYEQLSLRYEYLTPNIVVDTDEEPINPFEEKNWHSIKIGNDVILKSVKPVPSHDENFQHFGIYYGLWSGGKVMLNDEVFIQYPDIQHRCRVNIV